MSHMLDFPPSPLPPNLNSPPYAIFGINGTDITPTLPPRIPLNLVLHFAPTLRKWILPAPDPAYLPRSAAQHALLTPRVGIDIRLPIDAAGLRWILSRMQHFSGAPTPRGTSPAPPDLATALAVHDAWLALQLPRRGLQRLHVHIAAQLLVGVAPVELRVVRALWAAFPRDSDVVGALGARVVRACAEGAYAAQEEMEMAAWFRSSAELWGFWGGLLLVVSDCEESGGTLGSAVEEREAAVATGFHTIGRKAGKVVKAAVAAQACRQVGIMEKQVTRKVSPQERKAREDSDFEALRRRLRRTQSDDSLRSVDTAVWDPQTSEEDHETEEEAPVTGDMDDSNNYPDGSISEALATSLEMIRLRREARLAKNKSSVHLPQEELTLAKLEQHNAEAENRPFVKTERLRHRRSSSSTTTGKEHGLSVVDLREKIWGLEAKQREVAQRAKKGGHKEDTEGENVRPSPHREWMPGLVRWTGLDDEDEQGHYEEGPTLIDLEEAE